ncbi:NRSN1 [Branchiostoma lanceolatum]|uniref:NRSN1 protein n=1 Tax=Branchiostoma lanceolatum TaxID=7740 RepID=A0A8K0EJ44_BRALA|nr:NRSN1 [Branchiostoma lanceolatum]
MDASYAYAPPRPDKPPEYNAGPVQPAELVEALRTWQLNSADAPTGRARRKSSCARLRDAFANQKLESVSEDSEMDDNGLPSSSSCPPQFGVRSYLHQFYEDCAGIRRNSLDSHPYDNPYLSDDFRYLINPKPRRSTYIWWKVAMVCGFSLMAFGAVALMAGYLVPPRRELVGYLGGVPVVDSVATDLNYKLDACKVAGLILLCAGSLAVAFSLLVPSFLHGYMEKELMMQENFKERISTGDGGVGPTQMAAVEGIPLTEQVQNVQPERRALGPTEGAEPTASTSELP